MLKQGIKTINAEFIWTRALSQISFVQFRPYINILNLKTSKSNFCVAIPINEGFEINIHKLI